MGPQRIGKPRGGDRITYSEAASILGVTKYTLVRWVAAGYMPSWEAQSGYHKLWRAVVLEIRDERKRRQSSVGVDNGG